MRKNHIRPDTYLNTGVEGHRGISRIAHLEDASEPVLGEVANLENLQVRWRRAEIEVGNEDVIDDDGRFRRLVEGSREQIFGPVVEIRVGRERRPVEVEGHVEMALLRRNHRKKIQTPVDSVVEFLVRVQVGVSELRDKMMEIIRRVK